MRLIKPSGQGTLTLSFQDEFPFDIICKFHWSILSPIFNSISPERYLFVYA